MHPGQNNQGNVGVWSKTKQRKRHQYQSSLFYLIFCFFSRPSENGSVLLSSLLFVLDVFLWAACSNPRLHWLFPQLHELFWWTLIRSARLDTDRLLKRRKKRGGWGRRGSDLELPKAAIFVVVLHQSFNTHPLAIVMQLLASFFFFLSCFNFCFIVKVI